MDVPVSLAIAIAFLFSCLHFFLGEGEIWFDSVVMFIFFLTLGRHVELVLRQRNVQASTALARLLPEWARRLDPAGRLETVPASDLMPGDRVRVSAGQAFPADGRLLAGSVEVDESLLSGESRPVPKIAGESVVAGSINRSDAVDIEVTVLPDQSTISSLGRMLLGGRASRRDTEDLPGWLVPAFVVTVSILALAGWAYWRVHEPGLAMPVALAVLVASCPCALSLAMPAVRAAASLGLLRQGVLVTRGAAILEILRVDTILFDKTGTLTRGRPERQGVQINTDRTAGCERINPERAIAFAAALEAHSSHPLALAFHDASSADLVAEAVRLVPGCGLEGMIEGQRFRLGTRQFAGVADAAIAGEEDDSGVWLADEQGWICADRDCVCRATGHRIMAGPLQPTAENGTYSRVAAAGPPRADGRRWR